MNVAVLFSPGAGSANTFAVIGRRIESAFCGCEFYTCADSYGEKYLTDPKVVKGQYSGDYKTGLRERVTALLETQPKLFLSVGGDGLASYIADVLVMRKKPIAIMGIAGGTANVGPIALISYDRLTRFDPFRFQTQKVGAIEVMDGDQHLGFGFNDVIIGDSFLGTVSGQTVNISVKDMVERDVKTIVQPSSDITTADFCITKNGDKVEFGIKNPGQIILSTVERENLYGRAISGALCISAYTELKAAAALFKDVMISANYGEGGVGSFLPIEHLMFGAEDEIVMSGFTESGNAVIDGNPFVRKSDKLVFRYRPDLINAVRIE